MASSHYEALVRIAARAICANTKLSRPGATDVIYDAPDDLIWDRSTVPPRPAQRWRLYEERGRAALNAVGIAQMTDALLSILKQVERGRNAAAPLIVEHAFRDIDSLARSALEHSQSGRRFRAVELHGKSNDD